MTAPFTPRPTPSGVTPPAANSPTTNSPTANSPTAAQPVAPWVPVANPNAPSNIAQPASPRPATPAAPATPMASAVPAGAAVAPATPTANASVTSKPSAPSTEINLRVLLEEVIERKASDLHIVANARPKLRIHGEITDSQLDQVLTPKDTLQIAYSVLTDTQKKRFEMDDELDFSFGLSNLARFRGNVFKQRGSVSMVIRQIPFNIKTFQDLGLPPSIAKMAEKPRGLVLVTGPTGSGKSTTLAAMIDKINRERKGHIITVEDPIEFIHQHQSCIINQREVGTDTHSFSSALKYALREDPDVILIGEMRDLETIQAALTIAETGHLAFATLHTNSAAEAINRIIDVFPSHQQSQVRAQLAFVLEGIVTQTLVPKIGGKGRAMAAEILVVNQAVRALIRDDKVHQIYSTMQAGKKFGMQTLNDALYTLYMAREVALDECLRVSGDPNEFLRMAGLTPDGEPNPNATPRPGQPAFAGGKR
jgi:twitching motility protein PilT